MLSANNRLYKAGRPARRQNPSSSPAFARWLPFDIAELREITRYDELELGHPGGPARPPVPHHERHGQHLAIFLISMHLHPKLFESGARSGRPVHGRLPVHDALPHDECGQHRADTRTWRSWCDRSKPGNIGPAVVLQRRARLKAIYKGQRRHPSSCQH